MLQPEVSEQLGFGRLVAERRWTEAQVALASHFRQRSTPRFYLTPVEVAEAGARVPGEWREQTIAEAERWRHRAEAASTWSDLLDPADDDLLQGQLDLLQFAVPLSRAALYGCETAPALRRLTGLWLQANEGRGGTGAYSSPLLAAYRSVSLSWALAYLQAAGGATHDLECDLVRIMLTDAEYVRSRLGTSFPNNHLLADGFCLWYLGTLLPEFDGAREWRRSGETVWLRELARQIHEDGTSFEHAVHYQEFACEMAVLYWVLGRRNGETAPSWVGDRLRSMLRFLDAIGGGAGRAATFGDNVEGVLIPLDSTTRFDTFVYGELSEGLFDVPGTSPPDAMPSERTYWLLGSTPAHRRRVLAPRLERFSNGGVFVFAEADPASRLVFRTGPLPGSLVNPGHMHADLLSIYLDVAGEPLVVEAGTHTYRSGTKPNGTDWRAYFLGPACHNGLLIDDADPLARGPGDFPGGTPRSFVAMRSIHEDARMAWAEGENIGASRYAGHRRGVVHVRGRFWIVYDVLPEGLPLSGVSMGLQLAPGVGAEILPEGIRVAGSRAGCWCVPGEGFGPAVARCGDTDPVAGWVSPRYGQLVPATQLRLSPARPMPLHAFLIQPTTTADEPPPRLSTGRGTRDEVVLDVTDAVGYTIRITLSDGTVAIAG